MARFCPECDRRYDSAVLRCPHDDCRTYLVHVAEDLVGTSIDDRFDVKALLGQGGMGAVYRAHQRSTSRDVALKFLRPEMAGDPQSVRRFLREVRAASRLRGPHTVVVHDFGETAGGRLYLAMEVLEGRSLRSLADGIPMPWERAVRLVDQVLESLAEAHAAGIVHRDIKPENLWVLDQPADWVKVMDFGLARDFGDSTESRLTAPGDVAGTPVYMSPEQVLGRTMDGRSDLYSVGTVLFELLAGQPPFGSEATPETMIRRTWAPAPRVSTVNPAVSIPTALEAATAHLLQVDPADRPADAGQARWILAAAAGLPPPVSFAGATPTATAIPPRLTTKVQRIRQLSQPRASGAPAETPEDRLRTLLGEALRIEVEGRDMYRRAAAECSSLPARELFEMLAEEESVHADVFQKLLAGIAPGVDVLAGPGTGVPHAEQDLALLFEGTLSIHGVAVRDDAVLSGCLDAAIAFERRVVDFWVGHLARATDPRERRFAQGMIDEERGHVVLLMEIRAFVLDLPAG